VERLGETFVHFAPTWVCEVLSPGTAEHDIGPKFAAYEEHGVQEYWILDPQTLVHRFFSRQGELLVEFAADTNRIVSSSIPEFWVAREWLAADSPPLVLDCLQQILAPG
jgi:Uma2 family endonuclease